MTSNPLACLDFAACVTKSALTDFLLIIIRGFEHAKYEQAVLRLFHTGLLSVL